MNRITRILACLFAGVFALGASACRREQQARSGEEAVGAQVPVRRGDLQDAVTVPGIVRSERRVELRSDRDLQVAAVKVEDYQKVKKGDLMVVIDITETRKKRQEVADRIKMNEIQAKSMAIKFRNLEKNLDRKHQLYLKGIVAATEYERAQEDFESAKTDRKAKELDAEKAKRELAEIDAQQEASNLQAPFDGVASEVISTQTTNKVPSGSILVVVSDPSRLAMWIRLNEVHVGRVKTGMAVKVRLDAIPDRHFLGKITQIGATPIVSAAGGPFKEFDVAIGFATGSEDVREGFQGNAEIEFANAKNVLLVPLSAVKTQDGRSYVVVADTLGQAADPRAVELGVKNEGEVEVVKGLAGDEKVFVK